jgi:hypothetical protein
MNTKEFVPIYARMASIGGPGGFARQLAAIQGYPGLPTVPLQVAIEARRLAIYCCGRDAANVERQLDLCSRYASRAFEQSTIATLIDVGATRSALADLRDRARHGQIDILVIDRTKA